MPHDLHFKAYNSFWSKLKLDIDVLKMNYYDKLIINYYNNDYTRQQWKIVIFNMKFLIKRC